MTQRNVMNERNQQPIKGSTRKSAASAKPINKAASSVYVADPSAQRKKENFLERRRREKELEQKDKKAADRAIREEYAEKDALRSFKPRGVEYHKWRRIWILIIVAALVMIALSFFILPPMIGSGVITTVLAFASWGCLTAAIFVDLKKVKPLKEAEFYRTAAIRRKKGGKKKK